MPVTILCMIAVAALCCGGLLGGASLLPEDLPVEVAAPTAPQAAATVAELDRATKAQGVCFGWRLERDRVAAEPLSVGSHAGVGVAVRDAPGCTRWLEIEGQATPTARRNKVRLVLVDGAGDRATSTIDLRLGSLGLTDDLFLADTGAGILQAARALPLIAAEDGAADPVPAGADAVTVGVVRPLPAIGNDFWRDRAGQIWLGGSMVALGALGPLTTVILRGRRRTG